MYCCSVPLHKSPCFHFTHQLASCQLDSRKTLCPRAGYPCHISQLYGMVYRVSGLGVRARFVFDWQYISALRFPSALIFPASRYERLISFFTPCSSRTLYVILTPGCHCSVWPLPRTPISNKPLSYASLLNSIWSIVSVRKMLSLGKTPRGFEARPQCPPWFRFAVLQGEAEARVRLTKRPGIKVNSG